MSEQNISDPLDISIPLQGVESSLPVLPEADYPFQVVSSTVEPNKKQEGRNWVIGLGLANAAKAEDGRDVSPNFRQTVYVALQASPEATDKQAFIRGICDTVDALFGTTKENRPNFGREVVEGAMGKMVVGHVVVDTFNGIRGNKVRRLKAMQGM